MSANRTFDRTLNSTWPPEQIRNTDGESVKVTTSPELAPLATPETFPKPPVNENSPATSMTPTKGLVTQLQMIGARSSTDHRRRLFQSPHR